MNSLRKWLYRPKKSDTNLLAQFYFADEDLNLVAAELDSFDGRKDPERCTMLVNQLRLCQDRVLGVIQKIMDDHIPSQRANRDFRVKFPDDVLQEGLAGQLWFGAECLASGSSILNREVESKSMRPLARALTKNLDSLRCVLRDQCLRSVTEYNDRIDEALIIFDKLFAEFELSYVSAMVPVKTMKEYDMLQEVTVLFSEAVQRALRLELLTQDMIDDYDPALMFTIPRLAIVCGLLVYPEGPLNPDMEPTNMTEMFRPFQTLLYKIRELLYTLSPTELTMLEKALCSSEEPEVSTPSHPSHTADSFLQIDQGFDESGEGIVAMDGLGSNILVHSPSSGSPVTPVNSSHPDIADLSSVSPSSTLVAGDFPFSSDVAFNQSESGETFSGLNKSESQDSGLQSENVSTSGTVTVDCPPLCAQEGEVTPVCKLTNSEESVEKKDIPVSVSENAFSTDDSSESKDSCSQRELTESSSCVPGESNCDCDDDICVKSCCRLETDGGVRELCEEIVAEIVDNVVTGARDDYSKCDTDNTQPPTAQCDSSNDSTVDPCDTKPTVNKDNANVDGESESNISNVDGESESNDASGNHSVERQFSWQYNIQFAIPKLSLSDQEQQTGTDRHSLGSFSSDSTTSENGPGDSVADFVVETLAQMNRSENGSVKVALPNTSSVPTTPRHKPPIACSKTTKDSEDSSQQKEDCSNIPPVQTNDSVSSSDSQTDLPNDLGYSEVHITTLPSDSQTLPSSVRQQHQRPGKKLKETLKSESINCRTGQQQSVADRPCESPQVRRVKQTSSIASSCQSASSNGSECDCDKDCNCAGSETSSYNSETNDEEEIALAIQAAELASRNEARARFRSSSDMIHRLFVCIAGVADQLQTNYASDLRHILKCVFELSSTNLPDSPADQEEGEEPNEEETRPPGSPASTRTPPSSAPSTPSRRIFDAAPPQWVPDEEVERCTACKTVFTFMRRRHHCRNCGKIFCGKCSSTTVPLPQYGHQKPVRVCHRCFLYQVTHFTVN